MTEKLDVLILWSGGMDSTALLVRCLREGKQCRTLSIASDQESTAVQERAAREAIISRLKTQHDLEFERIEARLEDTLMCDVDGSCALPLLWVVLAHLHAHTGETVAAGYVRYDDFWHHRDKTMALALACEVLTPKKVDWWFPFEWLPKQYLHDELYKFDPELLDCCWWCETDASQPCGACGSCERHEIAVNAPRPLRPEAVLDAALTDAAMCYLHTRG